MLCVVHYRKGNNNISFFLFVSGDTDTNACIVGSLVGAILGFKKMTSDNLVKQWAKKILSCKPLHNR